jgi:SAM-dependent methyltransferase
VVNGSEPAGGPKRLLGEIPFDAATTPLGGINPNNLHYHAIGDQFYHILCTYANLDRHSRLLDVGCGTGRLAAAIADKIRSFDGFDAHPGYVEYCRTNRLGTYQHLDVRHNEYNPSGIMEPTAVTFPYGDRAFDVVTAIALYNHFHTDWFLHYLGETARVLRAGGHALFTCLLLNGLSIPKIPTLKHPYALSHRTETSWHSSAARPLLNVAHQEMVVRRRCLEVGLRIVEPISYGQWAYGLNPLAGPDVVIAVRT